MELEYKGYIGKIEIDIEDGIFHGEVTNLRDVVTFQGESVRELQEALQDSVEDYLEFCAARGEEPERPFSGKFLIRTSPIIHSKIFAYAKTQNLSLNSWLNKLLENTISENNEQIVQNKRSESVK